MNLWPQKIFRLKTEKLQWTEDQGSSWRHIIFWVEANLYLVPGQSFGRGESRNNVMTLQMQQESQRDENENKPTNASNPNAMKHSGE